MADAEAIHDLEHRTGVCDCREWAYRQIQYQVRFTTLDVSNEQLDAYNAMIRGDVPEGSRAA